ncbi:hypothetical protein RvY_02227 [Ramazzottius varieornatus]|uniref:Uncharacterized protein n=1 Tax=Ramazzottius varieornatus TaxID=947166 RepID=A0A1D1UPX5_RAMVA|nr:hypothetical protein RvY_02227 [Ramazzottius varieornatus]
MNRKYDFGVEKKEFHAGNGQQQRVINRCCNTCSECPKPLDSTVPNVRTVPLLNGNETV